MAMEWELLLRLFVGGLCGALIGFERKSRQKAAGLRTHFLVAVGSSLIMIVSKYAFFDVLGDSVKLDPSRIAANVVSGIGFLGAGTILVQKQSIRGLTTAAGLWATAGIGLAIGSGMYGIGFCATILVLIGLEILDRSLQLLFPKTMRLVVHLQGQNHVRDVIDKLANNGVKITSYQVEMPDEEENSKTMLDLQIQAQLSTEINHMLLEIQDMNGVTFVRMDK
ncbi:MULTISPECIES: MgtC/SapB family protein [Brevibacillus]|uniref:MgtC/SapB family protein n=1 Tax=Brevibacillus TaxID=55080 RepID=UPI0015970A9A|nr:MgtC/SapB family protein [Brevibacillus laterosporus]